MDYGLAYTGIVSKLWGKITVRNALFAAILTLALMLCSGPLEACSVVACLDRGHEMRSTFWVKVTHRDKPLAGVSVLVRGTRDVPKDVFTGSTESAGIVEVANLKPGDYWLEVEKLGVYAAYYCFHVRERPTKKAASRSVHSWGNLAPATRQVVGKVVDHQLGTGGTPLWNLTHPIEVPISDAALDLHNAVSGTVHPGRTDSQGQFVFRDVPEGTYVMRVSGGMAGDHGFESGGVLLRVSAKADGDSLLITNREGPCGGLSLKLSPQPGA